jgi:hypothetical protein
MNILHHGTPSGPSECHTTHTLQYCIRHPAEAGGKCLIDAVLKVPGGVLYLCGTWPELPSATMIVDLCLEYGQFSARPYRLAQRTDASTEICVMALFYDFCRRKSINATDLLVKAFPQSEAADHWDPVTWRKVLDAADWQGTIFPTAWGDDAVIGLFMSLIDQKRQRVAERLELTTVRRARGNPPPGEGP